MNEKCCDGLMPLHTQIASRCRIRQEHRNTTTLYNNDYQKQKNNLVGIQMWRLCLMSICCTIEMWTACFITYYVNNHTRCQCCSSSATSELKIGKLFMWRQTGNALMCHSQPRPYITVVSYHCVNRQMCIMVKDYFGRNLANTIPDLLALRLSHYLHVGVNRDYVGRQIISTTSSRTFCFTQIMPHCIPFAEISHLEHCLVRFWSE